MVQGLTEFLPVSSSAHLILARAFFGWDLAQFGLAFDVACHVGTLAAVVVYFRHELTAMLRAAPTLATRRQDGAGRMLSLIVLGTVPIIVVGLTMSDLVERWRTPGVAAGALAAGAVGLLAAERMGAGRRLEETLGAGEAILLGVAQALALVPGVSRSGAILTVAMLVGLRRDAAARFAFLLSVPAILAAAGKAGLDLAAEGLSPDAGSLMIAGMVTSAVVGYLTVKYFLRYVARHSLDLFAYYRLGLAASVLVWAL